MAEKRYGDGVALVRGDGSKARFGYHAVAFYDLLSQRSLLESLRDLPTCEAEADSFIESATKTAMTASDCRKLLRQLVDGYTSPQSMIPPPPGATAEAIAKLHRLRSIPIALHSFADTNILHYAFPEDEPAYGMRTLWGLLMGVGITHLGMLSAGIPGRGSIEIDVGCDIFPGEVYGPVLSRTYCLEQEVAGYPRIVVGQGLLDFCTVMASRTGATFEDKLASTMADCLLSMALTKDTDGQTVVHALGPYVMTIARHDPSGQLIRHVHKAEAFVRAAKVKFQNDPKLGPRYCDLLAYFEKYMPAWTAAGLV